MSNLIPTSSSESVSKQPLFQPQLEYFQNGNLGAAVMNILKEIGGNDQPWKVRVKVLDPDRSSSGTSPERSSDEDQSRVVSPTAKDPTREASSAIPIRRRGSSEPPHPSSPVPFLSLSPDSQNSNVTEATSTQPSGSYEDNSRSGSSSSDKSSATSVDDNIYKKGMEILDVVHRKKDKAQLMMVYGSRTLDCYPHPNVALHDHLEGTVSVEDLYSFVVSHKLYWDKDKELFRRNRISTIRNTERLSVAEFQKHLQVKCKKTLKEFLAERCCAVNNEQFNKTFSVRGSILDRVSLGEQFHAIFRGAKTHNKILQELMFGLYLIPVPEAYKKKVSFLTKKEETKISDKDIEECVDAFTKKKLEDFLSENEQARFKKKLLQRYVPRLDDPNYKNSIRSYDLQKAKIVKLYEKLIKKTYVEAFKYLLDRDLKDVDKEFKKGGQYKDDVYAAHGLFSARSKTTFKLIFEIMRHYDLHKFLAWAISAYSYINSDNSRVVGCTVDGPEDHEESRKNFSIQIRIIKVLKRLYPKVKLTYHALEFGKGPFQNFSQGTDVLQLLLDVSDRLGHLSATIEATNLLHNLARLRKILIEICLSTVKITTGRKEEDIPLRQLLDSKVPITISGDDESIVRTSILEEFINAIRIYNLTPQEILTILRASLHHSFLSGESIYVDPPEKSKLVYKIKEKYLAFLTLPTDLSSIESEKACKQIQFEKEYYQFLNYINGYSDEFGVSISSTSSDEEHELITV